MSFQRILYEAQMVSLLRDKNRFVLPVKLRAAIKESSGSSVVHFAQHDRWPCLMGFGEARIKNLAAELAYEQSLPADVRQTKFDAEKFADTIMSSTSAPFDNSGRFVLPDDAASAGNLTDALYFRGNVNYFTVWSPEVLLSLDDPQWKMAQINCRNLLEKELAKARKK